ncbi:MAG: hypothetical protein IKJ73_05530 [Lachnospiraceae bacterium]|nr:hypothetical protein [Lachnospiraceae bacterium]
MDNYIEQIIKKNPDAKQRLYFVGAVFVTMLGVAAMLFYDMSVGIMVLAAGAFLIYFAKNAQSMEYEYVFVNADCDIARISNKQNRKEMFSIKGGDVQKVLLYNSQQFQNELEANGNLIIKDFTSGDKTKQDDWYMFMTNDNGKTVAVGLELNDKTKTYVETYYKNKSNIAGVNSSFR